MLGQSLDRFALWSVVGMLFAALLIAAPAQAAGPLEPPDAPAPTAPSEFSFWIYAPAISRQVSPFPFTPVLTATAANELGGYTVLWSYPSAAASLTGFTLQESRTASFDTVSATYEHPNTEFARGFGPVLPGLYCYRIRATNPYGISDWSPVSCTMVYPGTPVLNDITNPNGLPQYYVSWQQARAAYIYELQESTTADFGNAQQVYSGIGIGKMITGRSVGTYYYRVRAIHLQVVGAWSNVVSTTVSALSEYREDFSKSTSGWMVTSAPSYTVGYFYGTYRIYVPPEPGVSDYWFVNPAVLAPKQPPAGSAYCASVDTWFNAPDSGYWAIRGLVFGAQPDLSYIYSLQISADGEGGLFNALHGNYRFPGKWLGGKDVWWKDPWAYNESIDGLEITEYTPNHLKVVVSGSSAAFYINYKQVGAWNTLPNLPAQHYVGLIGGPYEVTPVDARFDNFMWSLNTQACP